jgi:hypothetical protein
MDPRMPPRSPRWHELRPGPLLDLLAVGVVAVALWLTLEYRRQASTLPPGVTVSVRQILDQIPRRLRLLYLPTRPIPQTEARP